MTTATHVRNTTSTTLGTSNVVPFRRRAEGQASSVNEWLGDIARSPEFVVPELIESVQAAVEGALMEKMAALAMSAFSRTEGAFDPIYLARLEADVIAEEDRSALLRFACIHDQSDELTFDDGWDD